MTAARGMTRGRNRWAAPLALFLLVILTRLPFLAPGFGVDADAWRVALTAQRIRATGEYAPSRLPGAPLYEALAASLLPGGALALNLASAIAAAAAALVFARVVRRSDQPDPWFAAFALVFTPVFYVQSVSAMDYVYSLLFLLTSLLFVMRGAPLTGGLALGLAAGFRLTALGFAPALLIPLWAQAGRWWRMLAFGVTALVTAGLCYLPAFSRHGWGLFSFIDHRYPSLAWVAQKATLDVWGQVGIVALVVAGALTLCGVTRREKPAKTAPRTGLLPTAIAGLVISVAMFLRLPHEAAYLLPAVVFLIVIAERVVERFAFRVLCLALALSAFVALPDGAGPIFRDHERRVDEDRYVRAVMRRMDSAHLSEPRDVLIAASWLPRLRFEAERARRSIATMRVRHLLTLEEIKAEIAAEARVYYLLGAAPTTRHVHGFDLAASGALPFPADPSLEERRDEP